MSLTWYISQISQQWRKRKPEDEEKTRRGIIKIDCSLADYVIDFSWHKRIAHSIKTCETKDVLSLRKRSREVAENNEFFCNFPKVNKARSHKPHDE